MSLAERGRSLSVVGILLSGAVGVISATQTWLTVTRADAAEPLQVSGADAMPLLTPLGLAVLALGAAIAIVGPVLRHVLAVLAAAAAVALGWGSLQLAVAPPLSAVASQVTEATGLAGSEAIESAVAGVTATAWPGVTAAACLLLVAAAGFALVTARRWRTGGRRYRTDTDGRDARAHQGGQGAGHTAGPDAMPPAAGSPERGPADAVDTWDDLSRGSDPTQ